MQQIIGGETVRVPHLGMGSYRVLSTTLDGNRAYVVGLERLAFPDYAEHALLVDIEDIEAEPS